MKDNLRPDSGTYILIIKVSRPQKILIGRLGTFDIDKGYYLYVGSAHGPGGVRSRVLRHLKKRKSKHWHIDYLRDAGSVEAVLAGYSKKKKECTWASRLKFSPLPAPVKGFGSTDCSCPSHLFFCGTRLNLKLWQKTVIDPIEYIKRI